MGRDARNPTQQVPSSKRWTAEFVEGVLRFFRSRNHVGVRTSLTKPRSPLPLEVDALLRAVANGQRDFSTTAWELRDQALAVASAQNAYETAEVLVDDLLEKFDDCPASLQKRILRHAIDNLAARGNFAQIRELIAVYRRQLPKRGYHPEFFAEPSLEPRIDFDDVHAVYRALSDGRLDLGGLERWLNRERAQGDFAPPLHLFSFYSAWRRGDRVAVEAALSAYLAAEGLPPLGISSLGMDNVLESIRAKRGLLSRRFESRASKPMVSVICSAYNAESTLPYAVRSLLAQTHRNFEILLCDDESQDRTLEVARALAKSDERIRLFRSRRNQGTYNVRNALIAESRGKFVTFHDGDDYALPLRLELQLRALHEWNARACVANWVRIWKDGRVVFFRDGKEKRLAIVSLMVERELLLELLPYRSARHSADLEMYERLLSRVGAGAVARVHAPLLFGLWSSQSLTRGQGSEALENGYRAPARRHYAELCFRQQLLGKDVLSDATLDAELRAQGNYFEPAGIETVT